MTNKGFCSVHSFGQEVKATVGIWAKFDPMKLATPEAFARDPEAVLAFYDLRRRNLLGAKPNAAHFALARLEAALAERGGQLTIVTSTTPTRSSSAAC